MIVTFQRSDGRLVEIDAIEGQINGNEQLPDNLSYIAKIGDNEYCPTKDVWGTTIQDVTKRIPIDTNSGGLIFFDDSNYSPTTLRKTLELLGITNKRCPTREYAIYILHSKSPRQDGYLIQIRFVSSFALEFYYEQKEEAKRCKEVDIATIMCGFIEHEKSGYGYRMPEQKEGEVLILTPTNIRNPTLYRAINATGNEFGSFGLGFGLLVENSYHSIYRIWSRPVFYSR